MPKSPTLTATLPDGNIITRQTNHDYKFVVIGFADGSWGACKWTTRMDLAEKDANYWRRVGPLCENPITDIKIIPVNGQA